MIIRMILHNGVEMQDIQFDWVTPRLLKLRVAWPEWFQYAEQMAQFTTNDEGKPKYDADHQLTMDTSERNQALVEEDNRIWDEGFLTFEQDMKTDDPSFELLSVEIPSKDTKVNVLQILGE
jgi:O-glycosyl hydrolase